MTAKRVLILVSAISIVAGWSSAQWAAAAAPQDAPATEQFFGDSAKGWQSGEVMSRSDGKRAYGAILLSLEGVPTPSGRSNGALMVTCAKGELDVLVRWPVAVSTDALQAQQLQWRFDNGALQKQPWMALPSKGASVTPSPRDFLAAMSQAHRLVIGTANKDGSGKVELTFDLDGGKSAAFRQATAKQVADRAIAGCS